jgi:hypothetical protein
MATSFAEWNAEIGALITEAVDDDDQQPPPEGSATDPAEPSAEPDTAVPDAAAPAPETTAQPSPAGAEPAQAPVGGTAGEDAESAIAEEPETTEEAPAANAAPPPPESVEDVPAQPFAFKADGKEVTVPGAFVVTDKDATGADQEYVVIPRREFDRTVQPHLADRGVWRQQATEWQRKLAAAEHHPDIAFASRLTEHLTQSLTRRPDEADLDWEDRVVRFAESFAEQAEQLRATAAAEVETRRGEVGASVLTDEQMAEQLATYEATIRKAVADAVENPAYKGVVDPEIALQDLFGLANDYGLAALFYTAPEDIPDLGLKKGDTVLDLDKLDRRLGFHASAGQRLRVAAEKTAAETRAASVRAIEADKRNSAALRGTANTPPAAPVAGTPAPTAEVARATSREEWNKQFTHAHIAPGRSGV